VTTVEVLAPLRLETRFAYDDKTDTWRLRLRVYPDEFSVCPAVPPPSPEELDRLTEAAGSGLPPADAFADFAAAVGAGRALLLWRRHLRPDGTVDRTGEAPRAPLQVHLPAGLPERLDVWFVHRAGPRERRATLTLDLAAIAADLDLVATGSSDHHGLGKIDHDLGVNTTDPEQYERLLSLAANELGG